MRTKPLDGGGGVGGGSTEQAGPSPRPGRLPRGAAGGPGLGRPSGLGPRELQPPACPAGGGAGVAQARRRGAALSKAGCDWLRARPGVGRAVTEGAGQMAARWSRAPAPARR